MDDWFLFDMGDRGLPPPLRPYQVAAVSSIQRELEAAQRCLCIAATGVGKTEMFSRLAEEWLSRGDVLIVCPRTILVSQTAKRLRGRGLDPHIEQGYLRGGPGCTVASYQSLIRSQRWHQYLGKVRMVIVDEVHDNYSKRSMKVLQDFLDHGSKLVGFTASPQRLKGDPLTAFYGRPAFEYWLSDAIKDAWLVPPKLWLTVAKEWDFSRFGQGIADFEAHELDQILRKEESVQMVAALVRDHYENECSVVFCHSIHQAESVKEVLERHGITASIVHSKQQDDEREQNMDDFVKGRTKICLNVQVLTMGFDHAPIKKLFLCKPTKSEARYLQQIGRGCRAYPGTLDGLAFVHQRLEAIAKSPKPHFEIFDITDSSRHCQLVTALDVLAGPKVPPNIVKRAKKRLEGSGEALPVDELLEQERLAEAQEEAARYALERERRRELIIGVTFDAYSRDPFAAAEVPDKPKRREWHMLWGKDKGKPLSEVDGGYLFWFYHAFVHKTKNRAFMEGIKNELARRKKGKRAV